MSALRRLPAQHLSFAFLLVLAMLARLVVPSGWMPVFDGHRLQLELCGGGIAPPQPAIMHGGHDGAVDDHGNHGKAELPCPYAALSFAATGADGLASVVARPLYDRPAAMPDAPVTIGRGLAAPPPPATGPPALT